MRKPFFNIVLDSARPKEADILLYGVIGDWWGTSQDNPLSALDFVREFKKLEQNYERINIRINSPGGIIEEGLPIFNAIAKSKTETHTYVDGIAFSMGAIIALSGKTVHAAKNSLFLLHNASTIAIGNADDMRITAKELDIYDESLIASLASKSGKIVEDLKSKWFDYKDHLMTADQAKEEGFVDVIEDYVAENIPSGISNLDHKGIFEFYLTQNNTNMNWEKIVNGIKSILGIEDPEKVTENVQALKDDLSAKDETITGLQKTIDEYAAERITANDKITGLETDITNANSTIAQHEQTIADLTEKLSKRPGASVPKADAEVTDPIETEETNSGWSDNQTEAAKKAGLIE